MTRRRVTAVVVVVLVALAATAARAQSPIPPSEPVAVPQAASEQPMFFLGDLFSSNSNRTERRYFPSTLNLPRFPELAPLELPEEIGLAPFPELAPLDLPDTLDLPVFPELIVPRFPNTVTLPPFPVIEPPQFPATLDLPDPPELEKLELPDTMNLPDPPELAELELPGELESPIAAIQRQTTEFEAVSAEIAALAEGAEGATGISIGVGRAPMSEYRLAGYTAPQMANTMTSSMSTAMSYARALRSLPVVGPTMVMVVLGFAWVMFMRFVMFVVQVVILGVRALVRLYELIPFKAT